MLGSTTSWNKFFGNLKFYTWRLMKKRKKSLNTIHKKKTLCYNSKEKFQQFYIVSKESRRIAFSS